MTTTILLLVIGVIKENLLNWISICTSFYLFSRIEFFVFTNLWRLRFRSSTYMKSCLFQLVSEFSRLAQVCDLSHFSETQHLLLSFLLFCHWKPSADEQIDIYDKMLTWQLRRNPNQQPNIERSQQIAPGTTIFWFYYQKIREIQPLFSRVITKLQKWPTFKMSQREGFNRTREASSYCRRTWFQHKRSLRENYLLRRSHKVQNTLCECIRLLVGGSGR